ncbi:hypothetical protein JX360_02080 [Synechococcus bigranulatus str. 'Rupite']|uniref:Uncharacterized protein n=1 Tax=Thermostichus vulcanus str. 'Rupite' TaxID=2813851 RepID=A0ABT0C7D5_THEVL|nr:hypothetical protein [Thermostichus vulcanus str. 'Rupite']
MLSSSSATPPPVAVAPTLAPNNNPTTVRPAPDFAPITPPPVRPNLPDQPQFDPTNPNSGFNANQELASLSYKVDIVDLIVRGTIASVDIQVLNITCGTDVTDVILPTALEQFKNLLIGRGNTFADAGGFNFSFTFPTDPRFFNDLRILSKRIRGVRKLDAQGQVTIEDELTGDDIVIILTIRDTFGQVLRVDNSIFSGEESRTEIRGSQVPACGNL